MYLHEVVLQQYSPAKCCNVEVLDIEAVRRNFNEIKTNAEQTDMALHQLHTRLEKMEAFYSFAAQQHPYVLDGFLAATAAKERIGAVAPPPVAAPTGEQLRDILVAAQAAGIQIDMDTLLKVP